MTKYRKLAFLSRSEMQLKLNTTGCLRTLYPDEKGQLVRPPGKDNYREVMPGHVIADSDEDLNNFEMSVLAEGFMSFDTERKQKPFVLLLGAPNGFVYLFHRAEDCHDKLKKLLVDPEIR